MIEVNVNGIFLTQSQASGIILKEKRGYTAVYMPYSNSIAVEVFKWDELSPAEDNYRSGLLALENGIEGTAVDHLHKAANSRHADAAAHLGIIQLKKGEISNAIQNLKFAVSSGTRVDDSYAALSQILKMNNFEEKARRYAELFKNKTGLEGFAEIPLTMDMIDPGQDTEPVSLLETLDDSIISDTGLAPGDSSRMATADSLREHKRFDNIFEEGQGQTGESKDSSSASYSMVPEWFHQVLIFIIVFAILVALILAFTYVRWRKRQLKNKSRITKKKDFGKDLQAESKTMTAKARYASKAYKKAGTYIDKTTDPDNKGHKAEEKAEGRELPNREKEEEKVANKHFEGKEKLFEILSRITESKLKGEESAESIKKTPPTEASDKPDISAKLEMAKHLQEEQHKAKTKNLEGIKGSDVPSDVSKLTEVARNLGIEKGSLEIKKAMEQMESDKKKISKLHDKFNVKKEKGQKGKDIT